MIILPVCTLLPLVHISTATGLLEHMKEAVHAAVAPDCKICNFTKLPHPAPLSEMRRKRPRGFSPSSKKKTLASIGNSFPTSCLRGPTRPAGVSQLPAPAAGATAAQDQPAPGLVGASRIVIEQLTEPGYARLPTHQS